MNAPDPLAQPLAPPATWLAKPRFPLWLKSWVAPLMSRAAAGPCLLQAACNFAGLSAFPFGQVRCILEFGSWLYGKYH